MPQLQRYDNDGLELFIQDDGAVFASISGYARMSGISKQAISKRLSSVNPDDLKTAEIQTAPGLRSVNLIPESLIQKWIIKDNPELAEKMLAAGIRVFLYGVAGYEVKAQPKPQPYPVESLPPADIRIRDLHAALTGFGIDVTNPRYSQEIKDLVLDKILTASSDKPADEDWLGVAEKAEQMGYPVAVVTQYRSSLGRWVAKHSDELEHRSEQRLCNGTMRDIKLYRDGAKLTEVVSEYMDVKTLKG